MLQDLPADVFKSLIDQHLSGLELKTLRLVSKECRALIDTTITALEPRDFSECRVIATDLPYQASAEDISSFCVCWAWSLLA